MDNQPFKAKQAFCTRAGRLAVLTELASMTTEQPVPLQARPVLRSGKSMNGGRSFFDYFRWASRST